MAEAPVNLQLEGVPNVSFYVGPDKIVFHVHQNLLLDASTVFKAAFSGNFQEASERSMPLPEDDKESFRRMIQWLYTRNFDLTVPISGETSEECYMQLAKLNTLADKYDIYLLKNHIVDHLFGLSRPPRYFQPPQMAIVIYIYNNTTQRSAFRKLLVGWYAYRIDFEYYDSDIGKFQLAGAPQEFVVDLVMALGARQRYPGRGSPFTQPSSVYHETPPKINEGHA